MLFVGAEKVFSFVLDARVITGSGRADFNHSVRWGERRRHIGGLGVGA